MLNNISRYSKIVVAFYLLLLLLFSIFSFGLTTPNLILINSSWFSSFQFFMWERFFNNRELTTAVFASFVLAFFTIYLFLINSFSKSKTISIRQQLLLVLLFCAPLFLSSNMLSNDIFNYIFNSRMIVKYQANPHYKTALEFPFDDWTRFMHNTHTSAPYGYGWTVLSIIPYLTGFGKFSTTWLSFRFFTILSLLLSSIAITKLLKAIRKKELSYYHWALFFLNPLVLLEVINNFHNDLWMMAPAIFSITLLLNKKKSFFWPIVLYFFSVLIKFSSLALLPVIVLLILKRLGLLEKRKKISNFLLNYLPELSALLMFLPLFTLRSQQFHPWYLLWVLVWIPFIKTQLIKILLITFSITSLFRYLPWMLNGEYSQAVLTQQKIITWSAMLLGLMIFGLGIIKDHLFQTKNVK